MAVTIEICIGGVDDLFDSLDPAPLHRRSLDRHAENYIIAACEADVSTELAATPVHHPTRDGVRIT